MSKRNGTPTKAQKSGQRLEFIRRAKEISEYRIPGNGLRVLFAERPGTGVITTNLLYFVGSRDEARGETGIAHMFEHMLFKPTTHDMKRGGESASMRFEREHGVVLNANTWKDRTTYYFSYPKEHFETALRIEAERMHDLVLTDAEFLPERANVLSEFDMYAGDEQFSLAVALSGAAFQSHTYGHETIGFREDIERFTIDKLTRFYKNFYTPENAMLMVVGDIDEKRMKRGVLEHFGNLRSTSSIIERTELVEPAQDGIRHVEVKRPSKTNIFAIGVKHPGFPSAPWFETHAIFDMLGGGEDSILHKEFVDAGLVTRVDTSIEPTKDMNLGVIYLTLAEGVSHTRIEKRFREVILGLTKKNIEPYLKKTIAKELVHEFVSRENSLGYTAELVEYASAGRWEAIFETEKTLRAIRPKDIEKRIPELFREENVTKGYFIGTRS